MTLSVSLFNKMLLNTLGIICIMLLVSIQNCESSDIDELQFINQELDTDIMNKGCKKVNHTTFECCTKWKNKKICFEGMFLEKEAGIDIALLVDNKTVWHNTISERNPPEICVANIGTLGKICFKFYDVSFKPRHFCLDLSLHVHGIPVKKIHIGCFDDVTGNHEFTMTDLDMPTIDGSCSRKNSTYFICCVNWKELICFEGQYLTQDIGIKVALIINNRTYWQDTISGTSPPAYCGIKIPDIGKICVKFYNINYRHFQFCLNLTVTIYHFPIRNIHIGCYDGRKDLPKPLTDCTVNNITETSFGLSCQHKEENTNDKFWLSVISSDNVTVDNVTALTPKFVVSRLLPGKEYHTQVYTVNKFGQSSPAVLNITTKENPLLDRAVANAVANIYLMYSLLIFFTLAMLGVVVGIVAKRTCLSEKPIKTFAQIKDELAYKLLPENNGGSLPSLVNVANC